MDQYFIWGMGLLGSSIGIGLKEQGNHVSGCIRSEKNIHILKDMGIQDVFLVSDPALWEHVQRADGIIIGTPIENVYSILERLAKTKLKPNTWITDVTSTKKEIMQWLERSSYSIPFVGSHPMAGSDLSGPQNANKDIFKGATIYITRSKIMQKRSGTETYEKMVENVIKMWTSLKGHTYEISYEMHDQWAAYLSHGLHLIACLTSLLLKDIPDVFAVPSNPAGGSFRDITRVSGSNPKLWDGIIGSNILEIKKYLQRLTKLVNGWIENIEDDQFKIEEIFKEAHRIRESIISKMK